MEITPKNMLKYFCGRFLSRIARPFFLQFESSVNEQFNRQKLCNMAACGRLRMIKKTVAELVCSDEYTIFDKN